jgi:hypothetical protein
MRHAIVKRVRTHPLVGRLVFVICPHCRSAHWVPVGQIGRCPRRDGAPFIITDR